MTHNGKDTSPLTAAQNMTPWWMMRIGDFDGLETKPSKVIGYTGHGLEILIPCEPEQASCWVVYGRYSPNGVFNGVEPFDRFESEAEARRFQERLLAVYPHLNGDRPSRRQAFQDQLTP